MINYRILFVGGPLHMETKDFQEVPTDYVHPWKPDIELDLIEVRYRLIRASVQFPNGPQWRFRFYLVEGASMDDYPYVRSYLCGMYPEISALPIKQEGKEQ